MRNLKRALSLGLTAAMISGLMVMGSSAASYADVTSENNVEAIEVLESVGIMIGDESGNFNPDQNVTRNEMAVVMANLMEYNVASYKDTSPFTDVPSWAEPYVAACWTNGITAGYSDTIYGGSDTVTTAQAALMLMKALGYFQYASDFGGDWQLATTRQGNAIDLFTGVNSGVTQAMTRNDVAQLVLNTLRSGTVEASTDGSWTIGDVTINNNVTYSYITSNADYADAIDDVKSTSNTTDANRYVVELGEQLYQGDLELNDNATDVFGRPARTWSYDSKEIGTYAKTELLKQSYTTKVTGRELYDLLGSNVVDTYDVKVTIDGVTDHSINGAIFNETAINRNNKAGVGATGNGVLTEVYVDQENKNVDIAIINTYLAIATDDYNEKQEDLTLDVYGIEKAARSDEYVKTLTDGENKSAMEVSNEDFFVEDVLDGDVMLVTVADGEIQSISEPETLSAVEISSFKVGDSLTADGTDYDYANTAEYDVETLEAWTNGDVINLKDLTYNVYLDQYGYAIGVVEVENPNNYLFITGIDGNYNNLANATYKANAIFLDGTMGTITIDGRKSDFSDPDGVANILTGTPDDATLNRWFTYTVNSSDVYTVDLVDIDAVADLGQSTEDRDKVIDYKNYTTPDGDNKLVYGNDDTVYLTVSIDDIKTAENRSDVVIDDVDSVAVGIDNVDIQPWNKVTVQNKFAEVADLDNDEVSHGIYTLYDEDGYIIAMVVVGEDNGANDSLVYIHDDSVARESYDKNTEEWTWTRSAVDGLTGEEITLTEVDDSGISLLSGMLDNQWYRVRFNADGEVVSIGASKVPTDLDYNNYGEFENWNLTAEPYAYVSDFDNPENAINEAINEPGVDTVLYHEGFKQDMLSNKGHTLYVSQSDDTGVRYTEDTVVVFDQENDNERTTEFYAGESGVERVINELHDNPDTTAVDADYEISVLFDNGRATTIVVYDAADDGDDGNWTETNVAYSEDRMFRLYGDENSDAETIEYNYTTDLLNYSFYVEDNDGNRVGAGVEVEYNLTISMDDGAHVNTMNGLIRTTTTGGLISDGFERAFQEGNVVDIQIDIVRIGEDVDDTTYYTLTIGGAYADLINQTTPAASVWVDDANKTAELTKHETVDDVYYTYEVPENSEVIYRRDDSSSFASGSYIINGVDVEITTKRITIDEMTNHVELSDTTLGSSNEYNSVTLHGGIVATYTDANGDIQTITSERGTVALPVSVTTLNITDVGEGQVVTNAEIKSTSATLGTDYWTLTDYDVTVSNGMNLYSATKVSVVNSDVKATIGTTDIDMTQSYYVAVDETVVLSESSTRWTGVLVNTDADIQHGDAKASFVVEGDADYIVRGAVQITLNDVVATYTTGGTSKTVESGDFVGANVSLTLAPATGKGTAVIDITAGNVWDDDAVASVTVSSLSGNAAYSAAATIGAESGASVYLLDKADDNEEVLILAGNGSDEVFVLAGETIVVRGTGTTKVVGLEDASGNTLTEDDGVTQSANNSNKLEYTVGTIEVKATAAS